MVLAALFTSFGVSALLAVPALAARTFESQLTGFTQPSGLSTDTGDDVWVTDPSDSGRISEYGPFPSTTKIGEQSGGGHFTYDGEYIESAALDGVNGHLYVGDSGEEVVEIFDAAGAWETTWTGFHGYIHIAVDNSGGSSSGRVYVAESGRVDALTPSDEAVAFSAAAPYIEGNELTGTPTGPGGSIVPFSQPWRIAVDSQGNLYVVDRAGGTVDEFAPSGEFVRQFAGAGAPTPFSTDVTGVAVDPTNDNVLVVDGGNHDIDEFSSSGEYLAQLNGTPTESFATLDGGIAVNSNGYVYVADSDHGVVDIFSPTVALPEVSYGPVKNPTHTSGTVTATINPNEAGEITACNFEYGPNTEYDLGSIPCSPNPAANPPSSYFTQPAEVSAELLGLTVGTIYHYRVVVSTAKATTKRGSDETFTPRAVAGLTTGSATNVGAGSATLNGSWVGNGEDTHYYFEWGITEGYGNVTAVPPGTDGGSGVGVQSQAFSLTGLESETVYQYRIVASNAAGTTVSPDQTFRTIGSPIFSYSAMPITTQAGGHPDIVTSVAFGNRDNLNFPTNCYCQDPENITDVLPAGLTGNPHATPQCTRVNFGLQRCSPSSQVGVVELDLFLNWFQIPVYNVEPDPGQAGSLGFFAPLANTPLFIVLHARTGGDYGLDATLASIERAVPPEAFSLDLWGVPAEASHNSERAPLEGGNCEEPQGSGLRCFGPVGSNSELIPFLDNPTSCGEPLSSTLEILSYDGGTTEDSSPWPATSGCDQLSFNPSVYAQPTTKQADSASGLDVDLSVPQPVSPTQPSPSEIRALTVKLPIGMSINPNAADGKTSCSDADALFGSEEEAQCPEFSKVGTASLNSSALPGPIAGAVYIGESKPGSRYRLFLTANGYATHVKLAGSVEPDPQTGQLVASFRNLPQAPFSEFNLHFFGSERGLLATPTQCGTYAVESTFTPWDASLSTQTSSQYFKIEEGPDGGPCPTSPRPFNPSFTAAVSVATAGAHSPFSLELARPDGNQNLSALTVATPPGFSATLRGIPYCSDASLTAAAEPSYSGLQEESTPSCPVASQIGTSQTGAGAGTHPVYLAGKVYLAGPYKGAPLSLAVITPAVSGPYDLGDVVVRAALHINPETAQITAVSDPLPLILQGIPLRLRSIRIDLNRPNFILNPTNCDPFSVDTEVFGEEGAVATPSEHFQVANCGVLPFAPKLAMSFSGSTKRAGNPSLHTALSYPSAGSYANVARVAVTLPSTEIIDNAHISNPCTKVQFSEGTVSGEKCPAGSDIGYAKAETPLLEAPLEGPVYLRSAPAGHKLPDIVAALNGQIDLALDGHVDTVYQKLHGQKVALIRTTFETVPDAPVSSFSLSLDGGKKGLLQNDANLCRSSLHTMAEIAGQNGRSANQNPVLSAPCAKTKRKGHKPPRVHKNRRDQG